MSTKTVIRKNPKTRHDSDEGIFAFSPYLGDPNVKEAEITAFAKINGPIDPGGRIFIRPTGSM
jgi:hypothetical protein